MTTSELIASKNTDLSLEETRAMLQEANQALTRVRTLAASWRSELELNAVGYNEALQELNGALDRCERIDQLPEFVRQNTMIIIDGTFGSPDDDLAGALPTSDSVYVHKHSRTSSIDEAEAITSWAEHLPPAEIPRVTAAPMLMGAVIPEIPSTESLPMHYPVLDLDFPAELIPSSTPGHFHLYLGKAVPSNAYFEMLETMVGAGILEEGFVNASIARGYTAARMPWVHKAVVPELSHGNDLFFDDSGPLKEVLSTINDLHQPPAQDYERYPWDIPLCVSCHKAWPCLSHELSDEVVDIEATIDVLHHLHGEDLFRGHLSNGCKTCGNGTIGYPCATKSELGPEA